MNLYVHVIAHRARGFQVPIYIYKKKKIILFYSWQCVYCCKVCLRANRRSVLCAVYTVFSVCKYILAYNIQTGRHHVCVCVIYTGRATTPGNLSTGQMHNNIQHLLHNIIIIIIIIHLRCLFIV